MSARLPDGAAVAIATAYSAAKTIAAISNANPAAGSACITEARVRQILAGEPEERLRPYLRHGDRVRMEAHTVDGAAPFGAIDQRVVQA